MVKDAIITLRLTPEHKELLQKKAKESGMQVSEYIRILILKDLGIVK